MEAKVKAHDKLIERHDRLLEQLWASAAEYKSATDLLGVIRRSHDRIIRIADALDLQQFSDAVQDTRLPMELDEPQVATPMSDFQVPMIERYIADVVDTMSAREILDECGYSRLTKRENPQALSEQDLQNILGTGFRRGDYARPCRVRTWISELSRFRFIRLSSDGNDPGCSALGFGFTPDETPPAYTNAAESDVADSDSGASLPSWMG